MCDNESMTISRDFNEWKQNEAVIFHCESERHLLQWNKTARGVSGSGSEFYSVVALIPTMQLYLECYSFDPSLLLNINTNTTIDLVHRVQIERRRITMSGTLKNDKNDKTGTVCE